MNKHADEAVKAAKSYDGYAYQEGPRSARSKVHAAPFGTGTPQDRLMNSLYTGIIREYASFGCVLHPDDLGVDTELTNVPY